MEVKSSKDPRGFTLIESLVVIAITAILAATLFPVFSRAEVRVQLSTCSSNQKQWATVVSMYIDDIGGKFPYAGANYTFRHSTPIIGFLTFYGAMKQYVRNEGIKCIL